MRREFPISTKICIDSATGLNQIRGVVDIIAHSQGTITTSNAIISSSLTGGNSVGKVEYKAPAISQARSAISAWVSGAHVVYGTNTFDIINVAGPNLNLVEFVGGIFGTIVLPVGLSQHGLDKHEE